MSDGSTPKLAVIDQALERLDDCYGGDMADHLGESWREVLRPILFDAWADGYTTGMADAAKFAGE